MITIQDIINIFFSEQLLSDMGQCAYQRLLYTLGVALPCLYLLFGMVLCVMLCYALFKLVVGK